MRFIVFAFPTLALATACVAASTMSACGNNGQNGFDGDSAGHDAGSEVGLLGSDGQSNTTTPRNDFANPVIDPSAPANAPALFGGADVSGAGPCLFEPEIGTLFPNNWLRPRFRFVSTQSENVYEITLKMAGQVSPLRIYTANKAYTMDQGIWSLLGVYSIGTVHVTVRSAVVNNGALTGGPWKGSEGDIEIAPVGVSGSVVYWTTSNGTVLKGFKVGAETVQTVITPSQTQPNQAGGGATACVACHTSTPDGNYLGITTSTNANNGNQFASIDVRSVDGNAVQPPFLTPYAKSLLGRTDQHATAFSPAHWRAGDHTMLSMLNAPGGTQIAWTDLEATGPTGGTGTIARTGDPHPAAASVAMSHDGNTIVYTSTSGSEAGANTHDGVLYTVPYNNRAGGTATAVPGASDSAFHQYYPTYSADDSFIAFNRVPQVADSTLNSSYNNRLSEVFVVPAAGGTATRLAANDPPACLGVKSPGITNAWPKWSPEVKSAGTKSYYFLVFSSTRNATTNGPQLYVAPIVVDGTAITTYAALYLWNQPESEHNHTPAWDVVKLPPPK